MHKILIMGRPGIDKAALARTLAKLLNGVVLNAEEGDVHIKHNLGLSAKASIEHIRHISEMCDLVVKAGGFAIADLVCPTPETRIAFGPAFTVWVDRVQTAQDSGDATRLFVPPDNADVRVTSEGSVRFWAERILHTVKPNLIRLAS